VARYARRSWARWGRRMNLRITLIREPDRPISGSMDLGTSTIGIATWRQGGDAGHVNATTGDGQQITIALDRNADGTRWGHMTIGADGYDLTGISVDGLVITGTAEPSTPDPWLEAYVARLTRAVSG
jgi:hypothetical protein